MGINNLGKLLNKYAENAKKDKQFRAYNGKVVAIDTFIQCYRFGISIKGSNNGLDMMTSKGKSTSHIFGIKCKVIQLLKNGILPVFVFDKKQPEIKKRTILERKKIKLKAQEKLSNEKITQEERIKLSKKAFHITEKQIKEIKNLLYFMGIPYVEAVGEAESQCAALNKAGKVDGVVTEDWDALLFGSNIMLRNFSNKTRVEEIKLDEVLNKLNLNHTQLIELCIILGTDYCSGIKGINPYEAYDIFIENDCNMEKFLRDLEKRNEQENTNGIKYVIPDEFEEEYKVVNSKGNIFIYKKWEMIREYYLNAQVGNPEKIDIKWNKPQIQKLRHFLIKKLEFDKNVIEDELNILSYIYSKYLKSGKVYEQYYRDFKKTVNRKSNKNNLYLEENKMEKIYEIFDKKILSFG